MRNLAMAQPIELKDAPATPEADNDNPEAIVTKALGDLTNTVTAKLAEGEATVKALTTRLDGIEQKVNRPAIITGGKPTDTEAKAFANYVRTGDATEVKALTIAGGSATAVVTPPELSTTILEKVAEESPIRSVAQSIQMGGPLLSLPRLVDEVTPERVTETGTRPESQPSFEQIDVKVHEMAVTVPVSRTLLEDSQVDLSAYLAGHIGRRFGQLEASWFVNGNGTTAAEGVLASAEVGELEVAAIDGDALIDLLYAIKSAYARRGVFVMNRATMAVVRKLKDADGRYLWTEPLSEGQAGTLLGRGVLEGVDMPNPVAGETPIIFGDFGTGYLIADRVGFEVQRDDYTGADNGIVKLRARRRVGGRVVMGEALRKLTLAA